MPFELAQMNERVVVGLDDVIRLLESNADLTRSRVLSEVDWYRRVLGGPREVFERLASVHVLRNVEHDNVVEHFHLESNAFRPLLGWSTQNELDLDVGRRSSRGGVDRLRVFGVGETNRVSTVDGLCDGKDSDKHADGVERVGELMRERSLFLAEPSPWERLSVGTENVDEEGGEGCGEATEEEEGEEDGERLCWDPRLTEERGAKG